MVNKILRASMIALAVAFVPGHLMAQEAPGEIEARIQAVQEQAMQHPEIQAASVQLQSVIQEAMTRLDARVPEYLARGQTLQADVAEAQAANDNARLHELATEAQELQAAIGTLQTRAMRDAAVQEKLQEFREQLFTRMMEINPEVQQLVEQLQAAQG